MIRNLLCSFLAIVLIENISFAQLSNTYQFSAFQGTFTPIAGGTTVTYTDGGFGVPTDEGYIANVPLGFTFNYNGTNYTTVNVSTNGFISFGGFTGTSYTNSLSTGPTTGRPVIAALWDDMDNASPSTYITTGTAPNRVFTYQWNNVYWNWSATNPSMTFQIKLYETTNVIEFNYQQLAGAVGDPAGQGDLGASIGITGTATGSGNFMSLTSSAALPAISTSTSTNTITAKPATGQVYQWIPYCSTSTNNHAGTEYISRVRLGTIDNSSSSTVAYENFTSISTFLQPSSVNPITVNLANSYSGDTTMVWIDFNHNGSFADPGELVFSGGGAGPFSGNVTIPAISSTVLYGATRMRVKIDDRGGSPSNTTACGLSDWGQVEDYTVDIENCVPLTITTQPTNTSICNGSNGSISLVAVGTGPIYQWQLSTNGGTSWGNVSNTPPYSGVTTNTLTITGATAGMSGYQYRALITGTCTPLINTNTVTLSVNNPAAITTNPGNASSCVNSTANFSVTATGSNPTYQWQVSTDGGNTYSNVAGATTSTLSLTGLTSTQNGNRFRVVVTVAGCSSVTSSAAILTVNSLPVVTITAPTTAVKPGVSTIITAGSTPAGASYIWTYNGAAISGANTNKLNVDVNGIGSYKATITDVNGCINTTSALAITADPTDKLFIYPNPSSGRFSMQLFSTWLSDIRHVTIYNAAGSKVYESSFTINGPYSRMDIDLSAMAPGVYTIHIEHTYVKKRVIGQVVIVR